jgi:catalase
MNNTPVFVVNTPQGFYDQQLASRPDPATGKPDPARIAAFFSSHPETGPFTSWVKSHKPSSSFANGTYSSLTAFEATNAAGEHRYVRWAMVPELAYSPVTPEETAQHEFLIPDLAAKLNQGPLRWHLVFTVAAPGDQTNDATQAWPANRETVDAGTLVLQSQTAQIDGDCRDVNYDPTILPAGLKPSSDPLLAARSAAYAVSFNRRTKEESSSASIAQLESRKTP